MSQIRVPQLNLTLQADPHLSLMQNLLKNQIPVASSCKGDGICGKCRVSVLELDTLPAPTPLELKTLKLNGAKPNERLSCQILPKTDLTVKTGYW